MSLQLQPLFWNNESMELHVLPGQAGIGPRQNEEQGALRSQSWAHVTVQSCFVQSVGISVQFDQHEVAGFCVLLHQPQVLLKVGLLLLRECHGSVFGSCENKNDRRVGFCTRAGSHGSGNVLRISPLGQQSRRSPLIQTLVREWGNMLLKSCTT